MERGGRGMSMRARGTMGVPMRDRSDMHDPLESRPSRQRRICTETTREKIISKTPITWTTKILSEESLVVAPEVVSSESQADIGRFESK